ncbi:molybdate ABC transporter permease subunit [Irregularibacter muris]|jgi:molybdate transport system permease protein|uniref:Molybdenum transport system permease n=1 Tax=Irregularibacter muris TaxID=1796619 RepID=A0AAE3L476_9FIRM|nr:molybdate ABC transporter permease subunit [Irregularibacter muris]MCR1899568.1 molybdate ABC transporter permease subunit [Irregularibacter muris]
MDITPLIISLKTSLLSTLFAFILGLFAANKVRKMNRFRGLIDGIFTLPMVLPPTVLGFFLLILFGKNSILGRFLGTLNINVIFSWEATVISAAVVAFPLMYRSTLSSFDDVDENLIFAAQTLGMSNIKIFWTVILPNALSGIMGGIILAYARALGEFGATMMLAGNIKGKTQTIPIAIYSAVQSGDRATAYKWTFVIIVISFVMIIGMNYFNQHQRVQKRRN